MKSTQLQELVKYIVTETINEMDMINQTSMDQTMLSPEFGNIGNIGNNISGAPDTALQRRMQNDQRKANLKNIKAKQQKLQMAVKQKKMTDRMFKMQQRQAEKEINVNKQSLNKSV